MTTFTDILAAIEEAEHMASVNRRCFAIMPSRGGVVVVEYKHTMRATALEVCHP